MSQYHSKRVVLTAAELLERVHRGIDKPAASEPFNQLTLSTVQAVGVEAFEHDLRGKGGQV